MTTYSMQTQAEYYVVHPLDDEKEEKCSAEGLGPMPMSRSVRFSLVALRLYLLTVVALALYRLLELAGMLGRHPVK